MTFEARIESLENPRVRAAMRLRQRRGRATQQRTLIDGIAEITRAFDANVEIVELFGLDAAYEKPEFQAIWQTASQRDVARVRVSRRVFTKLAYGERQDGLVAVARPPRRTLAQLELPSDAVVAVLEGLEKPGNVGAIVRTADAAGVSAVLLADPRTDPFSPNVIRASLGTVFTVPIAVSSSPEIKCWLESAGFQMVSCVVDGTHPYSDALYSSRLAVVLGSETDGLTNLWREGGITSVYLPMAGSGDSLNVSATAAILFYEIHRQRAEGRSTAPGDPTKNPEP